MKAKIEALKFKLIPQGKKCQKYDHFQKYWIKCARLHLPGAYPVANLNMQISDRPTQQTRETALWQKN